MRTSHREFFAAILSLVSTLSGCTSNTDSNGTPLFVAGGAGAMLGGAGPSGVSGGAPTGSGGLTGGGGTPTSSGGALPMLPPGTLVTYYQDIAPLIAAKCLGCHEDGAIAPFSLSDYMQAKQFGSLMVDAIGKGTMPPWGEAETSECQPRLGFKNDRRLTTEQKALFNTWVSTGMKEGDKNTAAVVPPAANLDLANANTTILTDAKPSVSGSVDKFYCMSLDPKLSEDVWLTGTQVIPGNRKIVHHVLVFDDPQGASAALAQPNGYYECVGGSGTPGSSLLAAWTPGATAAETPADVGLPVKAGSRLVMQVHYHPTGASTEMDSGTGVALRFTTTPPKYTGKLNLIGNFRHADEVLAGGNGYGLLAGPNDPNGVEFFIPAGATNHTETQRFLVRGSGAAAQAVKLFVWAAGTHMHYVGRDMKIDVERANPSATQPAKECLIQTPSWNFNWQGAYFYDAPLANLPTVSPGDVINLRCTFDNTLNNPFLPGILDAQGLKAPVDVRLGESSLEEMCLGIFGFAIDSKLSAALN